MELLDFSAEILLFLFVISIVAGLIDTLAGGGGLIALPALIMCGVPALAALGTNKLQGSMGTATATYMMFKKKKIRWPDVKYLMLSAFIGSTLGTIIVQFINTEVLSFVIPIVLLLIALYFLVSPTASELGSMPRLSIAKYRNMVVPSIGCYDGMFGPGTGSFFALAGVSFRGHSLIPSTAIAKSLNFSTNIASLIVFLMAGQVVWVLGITMMIGQVIGAWIGSHCLFRVNAKYLRVLVVVMSTGMLIKYAGAMGWLWV